MRIGATLPEVWRLSRFRHTKSYLVRDTCLLAPVSFPLNKSAIPHRHAPFPARTNEQNRNQ